MFWEGVAIGAVVVALVILVAGVIIAFRIAFRG